MNPPCSEAEALRVMANELVANHNRQYGARSPKPKLCKNCTDKNGKVVLIVSFVDHENI